jgi:hypothetical protein
MRAPLLASRQIFILQQPTSGSYQSARPSYIRHVPPETSIAETILKAEPATAFDKEQVTSGRKNIE